jgi:hypothetical protein
LTTFFWLFSKFENWPSGNLYFEHVSLPSCTPISHFSLHVLESMHQLPPPHVKSSSISIKQQTLFIQKDTRSLQGPTLPCCPIQCWHRELDRHQSSRPPAYLPTLGHITCLLTLYECIYIDWIHLSVSHSASYRQCCLERTSPVHHHISSRHLGQNSDSPSVRDKQKCCNLFTHTPYCHWLFSIVLMYTLNHTARVGATLGWKLNSVGWRLCPCFKEQKVTVS